MSDAAEPAGAEGEPTRWSPLVVALHWLAAAVVIGLIALGWFMVHGGADAARRFDLYQSHKSWGFVALTLLAARLATRWTTRAPPPVPMPRWEQRAAGLAHGALYALTLIAALSGWLVVSSAIVAVPTRFFGLFVVPDIPGLRPALFPTAAWLHFLVVWLLAGLVALHVGAALKHRLVNRDAVWSRMAPRWPRRGRESSPARVRRSPRSPRTWPARPRSSRSGPP
ncbi:MAG: cytochrome b [Roseiarcus sp.]